MDFFENSGARGNGEWQSFCSAEAMESAAERFAGTLRADCTIALHGGLGVGKTTFVRGLARGLGIAQEITSPSYNIYAIYDGVGVPAGTGSVPTSGKSVPTSGGRGRRLVHMDAYRLASPEAFDALMLDEFLRSPWCFVVEWPEKILSALPADALHLDFEIVSAGTHRVRVRGA